MTVPDLAQLVAGAAHEYLAALAGRPREAEILCEVRLRAAPAPRNGHGSLAQEAEPDTWLTPEQAASIAGVSVERLYGWAKGKRWASRPSRRCLRVSEQGFRRWLAARA